ncbi:uncharacterized protein LOC120350658 isoform X2 [Nilaparvata lugens]|uniref:uncharacterized protein LOC120350658 isoform X2 n=1 Tax=Nilaparvata lugens TaxID=108931 RepID=UPI00193E6BFA|nr:uncharacterized protein LOC120350658 isoform X2 [Nilaparvata lugens]
MHSFMNIHSRFVVGVSTFVVAFILVALVQYWLGHISEVDADGEGGCTMNDTLSSLSTTEDDREPQEVIEISEILPNCGIPTECPPDTFPVHIYTGQDKDDRPKLCVLGKYVISGNMATSGGGGGGRGLNVALVETRHMSIVSVQNFDLYSQNSSALESWLDERVRERDIIIAFTFDEASKELSKKAKASLYKLGSGKIQDLQFRSQWYMISQKGIKGFTALERLTFAKNDHWGEAIDERMCVPKQIPSVAITPDPYPRKNTVREKVCREVIQLQCTDFCAADSQHEVFSPALLTNRSLIGNPVFSSPIVVVGSPQLSSLVLTLQSLVHQPGIHAPSVLVVYGQGQTQDQTSFKGQTRFQGHIQAQGRSDYSTAANLLNGQGHPKGQAQPQGDRKSQGHSDYSTVINLFSFQAVPVNVTSDDTRDYIRKGVETAKERFPNKKYVIVIEEGVIVSPDFLHYMAQMVSVLEKDTTVLAISAWNPNGYVNVSSNPYLAYRSEDRPQYAYMVPFNAFYANKLTQNCSKQSHRETSSNSSEAVDIIYPEVSRVLKRPLDILLSGKPYAYHLDIPRSTNIDPAVWIEKPECMIMDRYVEHLESFLNQSREFVIANEDIASCPSNFPISNILFNDMRNHSIITMYYKESNSDNHTVLRALAGCFGLRFPSDNNPTPPGLFRGILRFTFNNRHVMLIESKSQFYKPKQNIVENKSM